MRKKVILLLATVALLVTADQLSKAWVVGHFKLYESRPVVGNLVRLTFIYNENAAFGLKPQRALPFLSGQTFFVIFSSAAALFVLYLYFSALPGERGPRLAFMLILGGAAGNFIDRVRFHKVIDFVDCDFPDFIMERWPVFNVADSCVTVGLTLLVLLSLWQGYAKKFRKNG